MSAPSSASALPGRTVLHIFNGFLNPTGGSELEALSLYALLRQDCEVHLWATSSRV
ncbi:MAG: glycosyltransferase family 1 protein, partial [Herminiimonas sp.]|nr:glycosyltransferase family 1 protein [Herminiimonas sp.]